MNAFSRFVGASAKSSDSNFSLSESERSPPEPKLPGIFPSWQPIRNKTFISESLDLSISPITTQSFEYGSTPTFMLERSIKRSSENSSFVQGFSPKRRTILSRTSMTFS